MPINADIPLQIKPVVLPDAMQSYGNALAMKSHIQQQQLQRQQMQENAFKLKAAQDGQAEDDIIKQSYLKNKGDIEAVANDVSGRVSPTKIRSLVQLGLQDQTARAGLADKELELQGKKYNYAAGSLQAIRSLPKEKRQEAWANAIPDAVAKKYLTAEEAKAYPVEVPDDDFLDAHIAAYLGGERASTRDLAQRNQKRQDETAANAASKEAREVQLFPGQLAENQAKAQQASAANVARIFGSATTYGGYNKLVGQQQNTLAGITPPAASAPPAAAAVPPAQAPANQPANALVNPTAAPAQPAAPAGYGLDQALAPAPQQFKFAGPQTPEAATPAPLVYGAFPDFSAKDPKTPISAEDRAAIRNAGMTPDQASSREQAASNAAQTAHHQRSMENYQAQSLQLRRESASHTNTADQRQAQTEIQKLEATERDLNFRTTRLAKALKGSMYMTPAGVLKPMSDLKPEEQTAARDDMTAQYSSMADNLKKTIESKYAQYGRLGVAPNIALPDVFSAIDNGAEQVLNPAPKGEATAKTPNKPAAPTAKPATSKPAAVKPAAITEADARKRAAAAGTDADWYVAQLKQRGLLQ